MKLPSPDFYLEQVAASRGSQRVRLEALRGIRHPSFAFLRRIIRSDAPLKIRALAATRYQQKMEARRHAANK
ncbi:MAG: hypothetical protein ACRD2G_14000 [Terriglobia bacterium]